MCLSRGEDGGAFFSARVATAPGPITLADAHFARAKIVLYCCQGDEAHPVYVCRACGRYIKATDLDKTEREPLLPVERILTVSLDLAAREERRNSGRGREECGRLRFWLWTTIRTS